MLGGLGLGHDRFKARGNAADFVEQRAPRIRDRCDVGLLRVHPGLGVRAQRLDLLVHLAGPRVGAVARLGKRLLGLAGLARLSPSTRRLIARGRGPQGAQGPKGDPGPKGASGLSGYEIVSTRTTGGKAG